MLNGSFAGLFRDTVLYYNPQSGWKGAVAMTVSTTLGMTEGQKKEIVRLFENGGRRALEIVEGELDSEKAQRIISSGDLLCEDFPELLIKLAKGKYPDEEVESDYVYPSGYGPNDITAQTNILRDLFPGVSYAKEILGESSLSRGAEAFFAIPKWQTVADTYEKAVEKVLEALASQRAFYNYRKGQLGSEHLKRSERTERMLQTLAQQQGNQDILLVPAQFGLKHRGKSVRRAREIFTAQEFGLGAFEVGIMLLTHPERLIDYDDLWLDCPGDEYSPDADGLFDSAPYFGFDGGGVGFIAGWAGEALAHYGSVSAFLPK